MPTSPLAGFESLGRRVANSNKLAELAGAGTPATSLEIREQTGRRRSIILLGRAMPYSGISWEVEQRVKTTYYPGNPVASQQVLGPMEGPCQMEGTWKDRFMIGSISVDGSFETDTAEKAVVLFGEIARSGVSVRVQWLNEVRTGVLRRFRPNWLRATDCEWQIEFEWNGRNDEVAPRSADTAVPASDAFNLLNEIDDALAFGAEITDITRAFTASIVTLVEGIRQRVSAVFNLLRIAENVINLPATVLGALNAAVGALTRELGELIQRLGARSNVVAGNDVSLPRVGSTASPLSATSAAPTSSAVTQELKFEVWRRTMIRSAARLRVTMQRALLQQQQRAQPGTARQIVAKEGDSLYHISQQTYGSPDFANFLAQTNGLRTASVPAGTVLRIPPRPFGAAGFPDVTSRPDDC